MLYILVLMQRISIIVFLLISCHNKNKISSQYFIREIEKGTDSTINKQYNSQNQFLSSLTRWTGATYKTKFLYSNSKLNSIEGYLFDRLYGHSFQFYDNGRLESYCYYIGDQKICSYLRKYDTIGHLIELNGNPFVDYIKNDSDSVELFFSTAFYDSVSAYYTYKNLPERRMNLMPSSMQPMLLEAKIPISDSVLKLRLFSIDKYIGESQAHYDTIQIK